MVGTVSPLTHKGDDYQSENEIKEEDELWNFYPC